MSAMNSGIEQDDDQNLVIAFGRELAAERTAAGYTLRELAKLAGVSTESLHRYEHAKREIRLGDLRKVAKALDLTPAKMVDAAERRAARESSPDSAA